MNEPNAGKEELLERVRQLEAGNAVQRGLLEQMSHDTRGLMNGVAGMLNLLLDTKLDDKQRRFAEIARSSCKVLLSSLNDFLDFSKSETGELELDAVDFALRGLLDEVISAFAPQTDANGVKLRCAVAPDIPAQWRGDPGRLRQILFNFVGGAVKATQRGEVSVDVSMEPGGLLRFSVRHSGGELPGGATDDFGLALSKRLVELMDGQTGATGDSARWFTARLARPAAAAGAAPPRPSPGMAGRRLLLCEDNSANQLVAQCVLESLGLELDTANDGAEALKALESRTYALVVMDVQMPVLDGLELARLIRDPSSKVLDHHVPILGLTACALHGDRERFIAAGMDDVETKPFDLDTLAEKALRMTRPK